MFMQEPQRSHEFPQTSTSCLRKSFLGFCFAFLFSVYEVVFWHLLRISLQRSPESFLGLYCALHYYEKNCYTCACLRTISLCYCGERSGQFLCSCVHCMISAGKFCMFDRCPFFKTCMRFCNLSAWNVPADLRPGPR